MLLNIQKADPGSRAGIIKSHVPGGPRPGSSAEDMGRSPWWCEGLPGRGRGRGSAGARVPGRALEPAWQGWEGQGGQSGVDEEQGRRRAAGSKFGSEL